MNRLENSAVAFTSIAVIILLSATFFSNVAIADHCKGKHRNDAGCDSGGGGGNDTTSPAPIQDFYVEHPTFSTSVKLRWISPGDDGMSGSVDHYSLTTAAQFDLSVCDGPGPYDFSNAQSAAPPPTSPANWIYNYPVEGLTPETCYAFELEAFDEAGNSSGPAVTAAATISAPVVDGWIHETVPPDAYTMELSFDPNSSYDPVVLGSTHRDYTRFYRRSSDGTWSNTKILRGCCENFVDLAFNAVDSRFGAVFHGKRARPQYAEQQLDGSWQITEIVRDAAGFGNEALQYDDSGRAYIAYSLGWVPYLARQNGSSFDIEQPNIPEGQYARLRFHPETGHPVLVYGDWDRVTVHIATYDGGSWSVEDIVIGTDPGYRINLQAFDYDPNGDPIILFNQELGVPYDYWAHMLRTDEFGNWDPENAKITDPTGLFNQNIGNMVITTDGAIYVSGTNTTNQAKVGKYCEAGRGFRCSPTMDASGQNNAWIWEIVDEGIGQAGRSVAVDESTGAVSLIAAGSDPAGDIFNYYRCDPMTSTSPICSSPPAP
jgi:hypothetical protein